jgi:hypothetical protein
MVSVPGAGEPIVEDSIPRLDLPTRLLGRPELANTLISRPSSLDCDATLGTDVMASNKALNIYTNFLMYDAHFR